MKIVVYQSFRTTKVPGWIDMCMNTVKNWAAINRYDYRFFDDELFDKVPPWYLQRVNRQIHLVSDLARLYLAQDLHNEGYDIAIWIDADVLVFSPEKIWLPLDSAYTFSKEVYVDYDQKQNIRAFKRVNNAVMLMTKDNHFLPFYIDAAERIIKNNRKIRRTAIGTDFLTQLNKALPLNHIACIGLFSPLVMKDLQKGFGASLDLFCNVFNSPIGAANLCFTFNNEDIGVLMQESVYNDVIDKLLSSGGEIINKRMPSL